MMYINNLNEQLFETRNKQYGAYQIRKHYNRRVVFSTAFATSMFLIFCLSALVFDKKEISENKYKISSIELIKIDDTKIHEIKKDVPKENIKNQSIKKIENQTSFVPNDTTTTEKNVDITKNKENGSPKGQDTTGTGIVDTRGKGNLPIDSTFLKTYDATTVDINPEFPGGYAALMKFLKENIVYPTLAKEEKISGTVYLSFVVDKEGNVTGVQNMNTIQGGCTKEAVRVVSNMPKWNPGKVNGQSVSVKYTLPIKFALK